MNTSAIAEPSESTNLNLSAVEIIDKPRAEKPLPKWVKVSDAGLEIDKPDLTYDEWSEVMQQIFKRDKRRQWEIGDALLVGENTFGDQCYQVVDENEEAEKEEEGRETYRQYMQVSSRIPLGSRLPKLSWGHHQAVAYLPPDRRDYWLRRALDEKLKREELRRVARRERRQAEKKSKRVPRKSELDFIHSEEAQEYFNQYIEALKLLEPHVPKGTPSARMMNHAQQGQVKWQRDRTIEADCNAIVEMFAGRKGLTGVYRASDSEISVWLNRNNYFMGDLDLDDRLELMVDKKMLDIVDREESRQIGRRGSMDTVYQLNPDYEALLENTNDEEDDGF